MRAYIQKNIPQGGLRRRPRSGKLKVKGVDGVRVDREKVRDFFDGCAAGWDAGRMADPRKLRAILAAAGVVPGARVLDVACGTGVLFPYYLELGAESVTGVDISPEMLKAAAAKFSDPRIRLVCGDAQELAGGEYDCVVVFNALPHFPDPAALIVSLSALLVPGGRLTVAHDRCRASINGWHEQTASSVSRGLPDAESLSRLFVPQLIPDTVLDGDDRYIVSGTKAKEEH